MMRAAPPTQPEKRCRTVRLVLGPALAVLAWAPLSEAGAVGKVPHFTDVTPGSGIHFQHTSGEPLKKDLIFEVKGGGVGVFDYDNDGWLDIYFVQGSTLERYRAGSNPHGALYRNRHDGTFEDVTEKAGLVTPAWGMGVTFGDYDNDGWTDVYLLNLGPNILYHNNGDGTFTDVTARSGLGDPRWSASAAFADYDLDGDLDVYVANYIVIDMNNVPRPGPGMYCTYLGHDIMCGPRGLPGDRDALYRNNGDGTFTDVSRESGAFDKDKLFGLGVVWADFDNDGDPDIWVGDDDGPDLLFVNNGNGTFVERGLESGIALSEDGRHQGSMGMDVADYDNDGLLDGIVTHFSNDYSTLYHNDGGLLFSDVTEGEMETSEWPLVSWGVMMADFNHDGWKDIFHVNGHVAPFLLQGGYSETYYEAPSFYLNTGGGKFRDAGKETGPDMQVPMCSRGAAFGDLDNDGDIDVVVTNLSGTPKILRNDRQDDGHWAMFRTVGRKSNRDGIGVRLTATAGGLRQIWETKRGFSIYSAGDPRAHFGLGAATRIDKLEVRWPSGKVQVFEDVPADAHYLIDEESGLKPEPIQ
jgi:enediyne biosynthesis protein E4